MYTTLKALYISNASKSRVDVLARYLGSPAGIKHDDTTPIPMWKILDSNGRSDMLWVIYSNTLLPIEQNSEAWLKFIDVAQKEGLDSRVDETSPDRLKIFRQIMDDLLDRNTNSQLDLLKKMYGESEVTKQQPTEVSQTQALQTPVVRPMSKKMQSKVKTTVKEGLRLIGTILNNNFESDFDSKKIAKVLSDEFADKIAERLTQPDLFLTVNKK